MTLCRSRDAPFDAPFRARRAAGWAGLVNNRTQKSAVNPLTRIASRSVMHGSYSVAAREGLAATFDPSLDSGCTSDCLVRAALQGWITWVGPSTRAKDKQEFPDDP
jgi:hypothetical protein